MLWRINWAMSLRRTEMEAKLRRKWMNLTSMSVSWSYEGEVPQQKQYWASPLEKVVSSWTISLGSKFVLSKDFSVYHSTGGISREERITDNNVRGAMRFIAPL